MYTYSRLNRSGLTPRRQVRQGEKGWRRRALHCFHEDNLPFYNEERFIQVFLDMYKDEGAEQTQIALDMMWQAGLGRKSNKLYAMFPIFLADETVFVFRSFPIVRFRIRQSYSTKLVGTSEHHRIS